MGPTVPLPTSVPEWWCLVKPLPCPVKLSWAVSFKCRFYCYSDLAKPTDPELIAIERRAGYPLFQEVGAGHARGGGTWGSTWVDQEAKVWGELWASAVIVVPREGTGEARQTGSEVASLNNFRALG